VSSSIVKGGGQEKKYAGEAYSESRCKSVKKGRREGVMELKELQR
jgi:hypothetical protein